MIMRKYIILLALPFLFVACKPTEKGYKSAYDAALGKREAVKTDLDVNLPEGRLQEVDGPQLKEINGVKVYILNQRIYKADDSGKLPGNFNVAVGSYKMGTNCKAQVESLKEKGLEAFPAKNAEEMYYTIAGSFINMNEAVDFYKQYISDKNHVYVGLPDAPVIIYSPL